MLSRWKHVVAAGLAVAVVGGGAGAAIAQSGGGQTKGAVVVRGDRDGGPLAAAATYLGLTVAQVREALAGGKSLAQLAAQQGKTVAGLKNALVADAARKLDEAVAAGRLTRAQADQMLSRLREHVDELVNRAGLPDRGPRGGHGFPAAEDVAAYLGLTEAQLREQLRAGQTLAQVAQAQGKTAAGLKAVILQAAKERLDEAVASGRLTRAQADEKYSRLQQSIDDLINRSGPPHRGPHGPRP